MKTTEDKDRLIGWCSSVGVHVILLLLVAATGLFQAVSSESRPVDVEIYENMTDEDDSSAEEAAADDAASEPAETPAVDPIVVNPDVPAPAVEQDQKEKPDEKKPDKEKHADKPAGDAKAAGKNPHGDAQGKPDGHGGSGQQGPAPHDPGKAKHVKMRAQELGGSAPSYPESLRARNVSGSVTVKYVINEDGSVSNPEITVSSGTPELDAAATSAIMTYRYTPARNDYDEPVKSYWAKTFNFHL